MGRGRTVNAVDCKSMGNTLIGSNPVVLKQRSPSGKAVIFDVTMRGFESHPL